MLNQLSAYVPGNVPTVLTILVLVLYIVILVKWHLTVENFNMRCVLIDRRTGTVSLQKFGQVTALLVSTCAIMHELFNGRLSEWLFAGYMVAWAGSNAVSKWIDSRNTSCPPPPPPHGHHPPQGGCQPPNDPPADGGPA